jgi:hypothetical protein
MHAKTATSAFLTSRAAFVVRALFDLMTALVAAAARVLLSAMRTDFYAMAISAFCRDSAVLASALAAAINANVCFDIMLAK